MAKETPLRSELLKKERENVKISSDKRIPEVSDLDYPTVLIM
jgi:hypothetical protein